MKKRKKSNQPTGRKAGSTRGSAGPKAIGRRKFLGISRNGAIGLLAVGGIGFLLVQHVEGSMREHDLSRIGNGTPTVVQIHDPQCSRCLALQRQTRNALKQFDEGEIDYVIANIRSAEGRDFAARFGVQHVTLLLFDADGAHQGTLRGQRQSRELAVAFRRIAPR
ncbi:hypothetical protein [Hoeflea sp.]|uniref:hypothetical protein n=1 Tax=Hoeflea sp. TaxID=1940281 RepID=UPI003B01E9D5